MAGSPVATVRDLVAALDAAFPFAGGAPWDRNGLAVGDADAQVTGVLVALDPTLAALADAAAMSANVLLTHHPVMLDPVEAVSPQGTYPAEVVFSAIEAGVALVNVHTPLDLATDALRLTGERLGLTYDGPLDPAPAAALFGERERTPGLQYGVRWVPSVDSPASAPTRIGDLHAAAVAAYGPGARLWGDPHATAQLVVTGTGSASSLVGPAICAGADLLVAGEVKYHAVIEALERGLAVIELGHDRSEYPLTSLLERVTRQCLSQSDHEITVAVCPPVYGYTTDSREALRGA